MKNKNRGKPTKTVKKAVISKRDESAPENPESGGSMLKVTAHTRTVFFEQFAAYAMYKLSCANVNRPLIRTPPKDRYDFVMSLVDAINNTRVKCGRRRHQFRIPSYVTVIPMYWENVLAFLDGEKVFEACNIAVTMQVVLDAVNKLREDHPRISFWMADFDRIETSDMMLIGIQIFVATPVRPGEMHYEDLVMPLKIGAGAEEIVAKYIQLFAEKFGLGANSSSDYEDSGGEGSSSAAE